MKTRILENGTIVATVVAVALLAGSGEPIVRAQEPGMSTDTVAKPSSRKTSAFSLVSSFQPSMPPISTTTFGRATPAGRRT